jgi:hypothetical protein
LAELVDLGPLPLIGIAAIDIEGVAQQRMALVAGLAVVLVLLLHFLPTDGQLPIQRLDSTVYPELKIPLDLF